MKIIMGIIKPIITEKQTQITNKKSNRIGLYVSPCVNKSEIKVVIRELYNVSVVKINTMNYDGKKKSRYTKAKVVKGKKSAFKKIIVTLKEGETIDFFSNIDK